MIYTTINKGSEFNGFDIAKNLDWSYYGGYWNIPTLDGQPFDGNVLESVGAHCAYNYYYLPELRLSDTMVQTMYNDCQEIVGNTDLLGFEYICVPEDCNFYDIDNKELRYCVYALVHNKTMFQFVGYITFYNEREIANISISVIPDENYVPSSQS